MGGGGGWVDGSGLKFQEGFSGEFGHKIFPLSLLCSKLAGALQTVFDMLRMWRLNRCDQRTHSMGFFLECISLNSLISMNQDKFKSEMVTRDTLCLVVYIFPGVAVKNLITTTE